MLEQINAENKQKERDTNQLYIDQILSLKD